MKGFSSYHFCLQRIDPKPGIDGFTVIYTHHMENQLPVFLSPRTRSVVRKIQISCLVSKIDLHEIIFIRLSLIYATQYRAVVIAGMNTSHTTKIRELMLIENLAYWS